MNIAETLTALYESYAKVTITIGEDIEVRIDITCAGHRFGSDGYVAHPDDLELGLREALDEAISGLPEGWKVE